ncbi:MAG TPA: permease prefix domain 1-containing protein [Clostridia bacterium]|nr:permease prefix domain 1-containing protein [Clostridia bacterium]HOR13045.1 permease prefix domain 1-containing protein [Clostridia bacterium]
METIRTYLDNLFAGLPKTNRVQALRSELYLNMEERYHEMKAAGKTENEAIGIVISEFGNIDELLMELNIQRDEKQLREATDEQVNTYFSELKKAARNIAFGVMLCILSGAALIVCNALAETGAIRFIESSNSLSLVPFFLFTVAGVGILVYGAMRMEGYKELETQTLLSHHLKEKLQAEYEATRPAFIKGIITGICLCIISPVFIFLLSEFGAGYDSYGVSLMLFSVALGIQFLIKSGMLRDGYKKLLKLEDYALEKRRSNQVIGVVASVVWPLAVVIFLLLGFLKHAWGTAWIVFPVTGLLFGIFSSVYSATAKHKESI